MPLLPRPLQKPNEEWAMDFISDGLASGQAIRALTVLDHFTRECVAIEVDTSLSGERVARVLGQAGARRGWPQRFDVRRYSTATFPASTMLAFQMLRIIVVKSRP